MRSEMRNGVTLAAVAILVACLSAPAAFAGTSVSVDFLWQPAADNDTQIYLHVSNMAWEPSRSQVRKVYPRLRHPEWDFPVLVFMAHESGKSLTAVWKMRDRGATWATVMHDLGIPRNRLVLDLHQQPAPRGKAHGYWRKHSARNAALTDDDIYYWVNIQSLSRYFETQPGVIVGLREDGGSFKAMAAHSFRGGRGKAKQFRNKDVQSAGMSEPPRERPRTKQGPVRQKKNRKH